MRYYVNKNAQPTGEHEIHKSTCVCLPDAENCLYLGDFDNSYDAKIAAKKYYSNVDGCFYCCQEIHTR